MKFMAPSMPKERDEDSGQFTKAVSDDELIAFLADRNGAGTAAIADAFNYERPTAYRRLKALEDHGEVHSREVGNSLLWELADA